MKIHINEDININETEIIINCQQTDENILKILEMLRFIDKKVTGNKDNETFILEVKDLLYIDKVDKRTFLYTENDVYETLLKLYELEYELESNGFFRASKSSIINFNHIKALKPEFGGRIQVTMSNDEKLYVSRQYVSTIKHKLGVL